MVEKQNLILQQRLRFQKFLRHRVSDICSYNSSKTSLEQLLKSSDVVVLTADILVNALEEKRVKMTDLSLLLFDECHHTDKKHPFRKIMKFYLCEKLQESPQLNQLPQVSRELTYIVISLSLTLSLSDIGEKGGTLI